MRDWQSDRWSFLEHETTLRHEARNSWVNTLAAAAFLLCIATVVAVALLAVVGWHVSRLFGN